LLSDEKQIYQQTLPDYIHAQVPSQLQAPANHLTSMKNQFRTYMWVLPVDLHVYTKFLV